MTERLWLTWEDHRRSRSLARVLGAELCEFSERDRPRLVRYAFNVAATLKVVRRLRPATVICQYPSAVLALLAVLVLRPWFGCRVGLDAHNGGLALEPGSPRLHRRFAGWLQRRADFVIVHNGAVEAVVRDRGGTLITLPDPLPELGAVQPLDLSHPFNLLFVCTFKPDEPYLELLEAARRIDPEIGIHVTGEPRGKVDPATWPPHVVFCGRVPWERYDQLLRSVNGVIDLTTRERCLVCGAYEAVAAGKPMILSRTPTLMDYFSRGAVFTDNRASDSPHSIRRAILELRTHEARLKAEVARLKDELERDWNARMAKLLALL